MLDFTHFAWRLWIGLTLSGGASWLAYGNIQPEPLAVVASAGLSLVGVIASIKWQYAADFGTDSADSDLS